MIKSVAALALAGLALPGLPERLATSTVLTPDLGPAPEQHERYGFEAPDAAGESDYDPWGDGTGASLFLVEHRFGREGGEGGEGGEGRKSRRRPVHAPVVPLAPLHVPCDARQTLSLLLGAAAGGFLGSRIGDGEGQLAAVAAGTVLGAFLGHEIGRTLVGGDVACAHRAGERAHSAPIGTPIVWENPQNGHTGTVVPVREGTDQSTGRYCREYQTTVTVGGRTEQAYGVACRQPDGSWKIES